MKRSERPFPVNDCELMDFIKKAWKDGWLDDFSNEDKMNYTRCLHDFYDRVLVKESCLDFLVVFYKVTFMN